MLSFPLFGGASYFRGIGVTSFSLKHSLDHFPGIGVTSFSLQHVNKLCVFDGSVFNCSSCDVIVWTIAEPLHDICDCFKQWVTDLFLVFVK